MKKARASGPTTERKTRPALTPEAREKQLVALAVDLVEKPQVELVKAKTESLQAAKRVEELYANALKAMRSYSGQGDDDGDY